MSDWKYYQDRRVDAMLTRLNVKTGDKELYNYKEKKWKTVPEELVYSAIYDYANLREINEEQAVQAIQEELETIASKNK